MIKQEEGCWYCITTKYPNKILLIMEEGDEYVSCPNNTHYSKKVKVVVTPHAWPESWEKVDDIYKYEMVIG